MRMIINKIEYDDNMTVVDGITDIGTIKGVWKYREAPILGESYSVELNIGELYKNHVSVIQNSMGQASVYSKDDKVFFVGCCMDIDEAYFIRFTDDWIEMIEIADKNISIRQGDYISFIQRYDLIWIYPY